MLNNSSIDSGPLQLVLVL